MSSQIEHVIETLRSGQADDKRCIDLFIGADGQGRNFYAYLSIVPSRYLEYRSRVTAGDPVQFTDYGEVLEFGYAVVPPADIQAKMVRDYGFQHDLENKIRNELQEAM